MRILLVIIALLLNISAFSDVVFLNDGEEINGEVLKIDADSVYLKADDNTKKYSKENVLRLEFPKYREIKGEYKVEDIKDTKIRDIIKNAPAITQFPDSNYVTLLDQTDIQIDENNIQTVRERRIELICKERAKSKGTIPRHYFESENRKAEILFGRTINNGNIYYVDDFSIKRSSVYSYYPEYDDLKQIIISLPKVDTGSIIDYGIEYISSSDTVFTKGIHDNIYLSLNEPCLEKIVSITFPENMEDRFYIESFNTEDVTIDKKIKGDKINYTIVRKNIKAVIPEDNMPPYWTYGKSVSWNFENITFDEQKKLLAGIFEESQKDSKDVDIILNQIIQKEFTDEEKLQAIFRYITREIADMNISMWYSKYYPQNISITLKNKRGNYLDRLNLMNVMLKRQGIKSEIYYLTSKDSFHFEKNPRIEKFAFPTICVTIDGKQRFIDAGSNISGLGDRMAGKYYSVNLSTGEYKELDFDNEKIVDSNTVIKGRLSSNGDMRLDITLEYFNGSGKSYRKYRYMKQDEIVNDMQKFVKYYHSSAELIDYELENLDDIKKDVVLKVSCNIKDFAQRTGDKLLMFKLPFYFNVSSLGQEDRKFDYSIYKNIATHNTQFTITIPEGFSIYSAPSIRNFDVYDYFTINSRIKVQDRDFTLSFSETNKKTLLKKEHYKDYKKAFEDLSRWSEEYIVLEKN